jgi:MSHA biogenesis protein MshJ
MSARTKPQPGLHLPKLSELLDPATLRARWRALQRRFDQRNQRERLLLIGAAAALLLMAADSLWLSPALAAYKTGHQQQSDARAALATLQDEIQAMQSTGQTQARQQATELASWRARVRDGETSLRRHQDSLVGPDHMVELLERLLARQGAVRVRAMRSLGRSDLLNPGTGATAKPAADTAPPAADATPTLYRHGVELVLEGGFADLLQYLQALEALPQRVLWGSVSLKVEQHPKSVLTLRVYTISRDRHWLEI